jgi:hypothetical protein
MAVISIGSINNIALILIIYINDTIDIIAYIMCIICIQLQKYILIVLKCAMHIKLAPVVG